MASYTAQVSAIHRQFQNAVKRAKSRKALVKAMSAHRKAHTRILKSHLREEEKMLENAKKKLD